MITPLAALALLVPLTEGQWSASPLTPVALASRVDATLAGLRNTTVSFEYGYQWRGNTGFIQCEASIFGPGRYWMQVPRVDRKRQRQIFRERWISDGRRFGRAEEPETVRPRPMASRPPVNDRPAARWFDDFSRIVMMGLATPTHPFTNFVGDASRSGFKVRADQRQFRIQGRTERQYRLVVERGAMRYEAVIDGRYMLPTGIVNSVGPKDSTRWSAVRWNHTRKPLDPKILVFRAPAKATILSPTPRPR